MPFGPMAHEEYRPCWDEDGNYIPRLPWTAHND